MWGVRRSAGVLLAHDEVRNIEKAAGTVEPLVVGELDLDEMLR